jgi:hypothetical protein
MYFRFGCALILVTLVSVAGIAIEKQCLTLRRALSRQQYRYDALCELSSRLRLKTQQLGAPSRLYEALETGRIALSRRERSDPRTSPRLPPLASQRADKAER